jgi:hypothetical protein
VDKNLKRGERREKTKSKTRSRAKKILSTTCDGESLLVCGKIEKTTVDTLLKTQHAQIGATCSCEMCGNPRRHFGCKTRKEELEDFKFKEQMVEIENILTE